MMTGVILSIVTFILGVLFSYIIARTTEVKPKITVKFQNIGIINNDLEDVEFTCNNCKVNTLIKTSVLFWNSGNKCITKEQLVGAKMLHFTFPVDCKILSCKIKRSTDDAISLQSKVIDNNVYVDFEYLKKGDGGLIEVLHNSSDYENILPQIKLNTIYKDDVITYKHSTDWFTIDKEKASRKRMLNFCIIALNLIIAVILAIAIFFLSISLFNKIGDWTIAIFIIGEWLVGFLNAKIMKVTSGLIVNVPNALR
ncbi:MAG: hypothetical protein LUK37_07010 [Clostridia bacterium]|nr:hypothetical protein [Clostridia bacterium]